MSVIDDIIRDAMEKGAFKGLPGEGKRIVLEDESHIPEDMRLANRLLKENDLAPDWIMQSRELDERRETLLASMRKARENHERHMENAARSPAPESARANAETRWAGQALKFREIVQKYNREILSYNLKVPQGVTHKRAIDFARMMEQ